MEWVGSGYGNEDEGAYKVIYYYCNGQFNDFLGSWNQICKLQKRQICIGNYTG